MNLVLEILESLWDTSLNYKGMRVNIFGVHKTFKYSNATIRSTLSRLNKKGLVKNISRKWSITGAGKRYLKSKEKLIMPNFYSPLKKNAPKKITKLFFVNLLKIKNIINGTRENKNWKSNLKTK